MRARYIEAKDTAKLIRKALRAAHPEVTFSVRTRTYAGGASIDVGWTDGPTRDDVESVTDLYRGGGFDGSIDLAYSRAAWLYPDGSVTFAETGGTEGSRGSVPSDYGAPLNETAELVTFGARYVFTNRNVSPEMMGAAVALIRAWDRRGYGEGRQCSPGCGDWMGADHLGWVARWEHGHAIVCSPECAATLEIRSGHIRPSSRVGASA